MIESYVQRVSSQIFIPITVLVFLLGLAGCDSGDQIAGEPLATNEPALLETTEVVAAVAATWTPVPLALVDEAEPTEPAPATNTPVPTSTTVTASATPSPTEPLPTETVTPTVTATAEPTSTSPPPAATSLPVSTQPPAAESTVPAAVEPTAPPAAEPTLPPDPVLGANLLPNPSFEEGHYNQNGVPELQLPNKWRLEWDEGPTGVGEAAWDVYVRPEVRVLSTAFLPPEEHPLYIYNGQHTVKAFKGSGAVSFRLLTDITLEPGTYVIEAKMFADIVEKWEDNAKQYAQDPSAAEFRFHVGDGGTVWTPQRFGQVNVHNFTFTIDQTKTIPIGIGLRGKYAIANNGWFIDDLSVRRIE